MLYYGNFYSLNGNLYTVQIVTNNDSGTTREIILGVPPFTTEMDFSSKNIYKPLKCQSATVNIVTSGETDYMFDLYSGQADGTRVILKSGNTVVWDGFATPVLYENGFTEIHENINLECIDGLSILEYYKYEAQQKQILSFIDIINKILEKAKVYKTLYVSTSTKATEDSYTPILNSLYISEENFFDKKKDDETDADVAWTCKDVLEEICQYLGLVCIGNGDSLYLLDLDAIKNNQNLYTCYNVGSTQYSSVTLSNHFSVLETDYMGGNNTISLDDVYNKVSVRDSFYTFDSVIPSFFENITNITKSEDPDVKDSQHIDNGMYGQIISGSDGYTEILLDRVYDPQDRKYKRQNVVFVKYYKNDNYNLNNCPSELNYTDTKTIHGAILAKFYIPNIENLEQKNLQYLIYNPNFDFYSWLIHQDVEQPNFKNYLCLLNPYENHQQSGLTEVTTIQGDTACFFGGKDAYLIITGNYNYHYFDEDPYPIPEGQVDLKEGRKKVHFEDTYLLVKLKWGNQYYNGSGWTATNTTFKIPYIVDGDSRRADTTMFKDIPFKNSVTWDIGSTDEGVLIPCPENYLLVERPELTIYNAIDPHYEDNTDYKHSRVFLKDFDIKAVIKNPFFLNDNNSDTVYTNVIDSGATQELSEITFKICTNDNKNPNYSSVAYKENGIYNFLDSAYNSVFEASRPLEEHLINRLVGQYKEPRIRLKLQLKNNIPPYSLITNKWIGNDKKLIVDSQSIDYYNDVTSITLVEKA